MKKQITLLFLLTAIALLLAECKKTTTPPPSTQSTSLCSGSTWRYEVITQDTADSGKYDILFVDGFMNNIHDTTMTGTTWTRTVTPSVEQPSYSFGVTIGVNYTGHTLPYGTNYTDSITVNIYKDNILVNSSGRRPFCDANGGPACSNNSVNLIYQETTCN